ncbi:MAG: hypothetical protein FWE90_06835 [Defluviitaleaceae bacterium]|nr:hypothetical protein [Defluviitaleaceae bacterium]
MGIFFYHLAQTATVTPNLPPTPSRITNPHTRFFHTHEHQVRVHEMWLNDDGWFVVSPFRYDGAPPRTFTPDHVPGSWKIINHGQEINYTSTLSVTVNFNADGTIEGPHTGTWRLEADGVTLNVTLDGVAYNGRLLRSFINDFGRWGMSFTVISAEGIALWGAGVTLN